MRPALFLLLLAVARPSWAEDPASTKKAAEGATPPAPAAKKQAKAIHLEAIKVEGRIQKPEAFYFLDRSKPSFDDLNRTESFVPKVVQSVQQDPF
ncbi:hypothetical protein KH5H1_37440 [Corallococcus caeni]|uniref:Uncharacterized protein n=2 Tax=Corallococcus TaxID=83461 RepID=A0A7Y4NB88_9BACT|nr:hypothetical protein [Corallococcus exercitus]NOK07932.1 hypothetical protein [Corallococcus exercitus]GMT99624.1 hypothetical protein KH5H1_37440 [Corallococcus sp. KH5-1]GMU08784.1 hypothetical protein ASNO1_50370 [Corallococcus sp. NO1]